MTLKGDSMNDDGTATIGNPSGFVMTVMSQQAGFLIAQFGYDVVLETLRQMVSDFEQPEVRRAYAAMEKARDAAPEGQANTMHGLGTLMHDALADAQRAYDAPQLSVVPDKEKETPP